MAHFNKSATLIGAGLAISFLVVLFLIFSPIFPGPDGTQVNGLTFADNLFNKLAKGSSYFIPRIKTENQKFMGRAFSATIKTDKEDEAAKITKLFTLAGGTVTPQGGNLQIEGDLGKTMEAVLRDSDDMFMNQSQKLKERYGLEGGDVLRAWWFAFNRMDKFFKKNLKIEEAKWVSEVSKKAIEPAYNFYQIEPQRVSDRLGIMTFLLVFYVFYTLWWGYAIFYLFEGFGLTMKKAKVKKEV